MARGSSTSWHTRKQEKHGERPDVGLPDSEAPDLGEPADGDQEGDAVDSSALVGADLDAVCNLAEAAEAEYQAEQESDEEGVRTDELERFYEQQARIILCKLACSEHVLKHVCFVLH